MHFTRYRINPISAFPAISRFVVNAFKGPRPHKVTELLGTLVSLGQAGAGGRKRYTQRDWLDGPTRPCYNMLN